MKRSFFFVFAEFLQKPKHTCDAWGLDVGRDDNRGRESSASSPAAERTVTDHPLI